VEQRNINAINGIHVLGPDTLLPWHPNGRIIIYEAPHLRHPRRDHQPIQPPHHHVQRLGVYRGTRWNVWTRTIRQTRTRPPSTSTIQTRLRSHSKHAWTMETQNKARHVYTRC
jgi:hypothetical protein